MMALVLVILILSLVFSFAAKGARRALLLAAATLALVVATIGFPAVRSWGEFGIEALRKTFGAVIPVSVSIDRLEHDIGMTKEEVRAQAKVVATCIVDLAASEASLAAAQEERTTLLCRIEPINAELKKQADPVVIQGKSYRREDVEADLRAKLCTLRTLDAKVQNSEGMVDIRRNKRVGASNNMLALDDRRGRLEVGLLEIRARYEGIRASGGSDSAGHSRIAACEEDLAETKRQVEIAYQEALITGRNPGEIGIDPLGGAQAPVTELADQALARPR